MAPVESDAPTSASETSMTDSSACSSICSAAFFVDNGLFLMNAIAMMAITASGMAMMNESAMPWP
ncbi:hypothetical protein D3C76_1872670 [compost metagenome]